MHEYVKLSKKQKERVGHLFLLRFVITFGIQPSNIRIRKAKNFTLIFAV